MNVIQKWFSINIIMSDTNHILQYKRLPLNKSLAKDGIYTTQRYIMEEYYFISAYKFSLKKVCVAFFLL